MADNVVKLENSHQRFVEAFANYDLVTITKAALERLIVELDSTVADSRRSNLSNRFPKLWAAHCDGEVSEAERAEAEWRITDLCDDLRPFVLALVAVPKPVVA